MNIYLATISGLVVYLLITWFLGNLLHLQGRELWLFRALLAILGIIGAAVFLIFKIREQKQAAGELAPEASGTPHEEIDSLIRAAEAKLAAGRIEGGARIGNLPAFFLIGEAGSTKTSTVLHSGLEPELIAGHVFQENNVVSTRSANVWFARRAIFAEAGGKLMADATGWQRLVRRLRPGKLTAAMGKGQQAPRAALLCFDSETFARPGAPEALAAASRNMHGRLAGISQMLGIHLPVYVLFTRCDRLPFFNEYIRNLSNEESTQVLGATLPMVARNTGVYAEQEAQRLTLAFNNLYYSLCDKRPAFLAREHAAENLPGIYEFPREFRKLRTSLVQFLVDLARPSQLTAGPFLRGFYFSGVRPIVVNEMEAPPALAPRPEERQGFEASREATGFFRGQQAAQPMQAPVQAPGQVRGARKVPQWVFLGHLFHDVILADRVAMGASGSTTQANTLRRVLLASAAVLCLIFAIGFLASYGNNRRLESDAIQAASSIPAAELTPANLASVEALRRLETLRQSVERLGTYERQGAPMSLRWGLYTGTELYPELWKVYFKRFHQLLLLPIQSTMLHTLQTLPPAPGPPRAPTYETLKAYLITTSNHEKSTRLFLSPVLRDRWTAGRNVEPERLELAQKQFDFYAEELKAANPFTSENDTLAVERARAYLKRFGAIDSVYQFMLDEAARNNPSINFHLVFPAAGQAVTDRKVVPGAFSKGGWAYMQNAFKDPSRFFSGEQWVMGELAATGLGTAEIDQLKKRYQQDFIAVWREFIKAGSVAKYANVQDANNKLKLLSGPQSPLLQLFSLVSKHTAVGVPEVENLFRASQSVVPPANADVPAGPSNQSYMTGLVSLQNMIDPLAAQSGVPPDTALAPITQQQQAAKGKVGEMALGFGNDPEATTVRQLLEAPITNLDSVFRGVPAQALNAGGQAFCAQFQALMRKYPFNANATEQAELQEVNAIFKPKDGALWKFYERLQSVLPRQGPRFVPTPPPGITIDSRFVGFLERAAGFSDALYPRGVPEPRLEFSLRPASPEVQTLRMAIEGQSFDFPGGAPTFRRYVWPGSVHELKLAVKMRDGNDYSFAGQGLWAVFQFFDETENWHTTGSISGLEWKVKTGRTGRIAATVRFELDMGGAPPVFQRGYLASMACVSTVAR